MCRRTSVYEVATTEFGGIDGVVSRSRDNVVVVSATKMFIFGIATQQQCGSYSSVTRTMARFGKHGPMPSYQKREVSFGHFTLRFLSQVGQPIQAGFRI